jgi:hypothetical protein
MQGSFGRVHRHDEPINGIKRRLVRDGFSKPPYRKIRRTISAQRSHISPPTWEMREISHRSGGNLETRIQPPEFSNSVSRLENQP